MNRFSNLTFLPRSIADANVVERRWTKGPRRNSWSSEAEYHGSLARPFPLGIKARLEFVIERHVYPSRALYSVKPKI